MAPARASQRLPAADDRIDAHAAAGDRQAERFARRSGKFFIRIYIHFAAPTISLDPQSLPLFSSGFDLVRLTCPGDELEHQAGEREQRSDPTAGILLGYGLELHQGGERVPWDEFECPFALRVAIME